MSKTDMTFDRYIELMSMAKITIGHWRAVVAGDLYYRTTIDCPACQRYLYQESPCDGCYIAYQTGSIKCENTPSIAYLYLHHQYYALGNWDIAIELKVAAQDVLDFLLRLEKRIIVDRSLYLARERLLTTNNRNF